MQEVNTRHADSCWLEASSATAIRLTQSYGAFVGTEPNGSGYTASQAAIVIKGRMCWFTTPPALSLVGLAADTYNVFVINDGSDRTVALATMSAGVTVPAHTFYRWIGQVTWSGTAITGTVVSYAAPAPTDTPTFTGSPKVPTQSTSDNTTQAINSAWATSKLLSYAPLASPTFTGVPLSTTPTTADNTTKVATTAFVQANLVSYLTTATAASTYLPTATAASTYAPIASPTFTGVPAAPTAAAGTSTTQLATTAFVAVQFVSQNQMEYELGFKADIGHLHDMYANIASPTFTGTPRAPTQAPATSDTSLATTAFAQALMDSVMPPGVILVTPFATADAGYTLMDGKAITVAISSRLRDKLIANGSPWGLSGSDPLLPDWKGRALYMVGTHTEIDSITDNDGLSLANRRVKHAHTVASHTHAGAEHAHGVSIGVSVSGATAAGNTNPGTTGGNSAATGGSSYANLGHSHSIPAVGVTASGLVSGGTAGVDRDITTGAAAPATDYQGPAYTTGNYQIKL
jgi:hypothetical protein